MLSDTGNIPFPGQGDSLVGGHAVLAVGFDDQKKIGKEKGALLIRNSWGTTWGDGGYGWLPYKYVLDRIALDFWSLLSMEWIATKQFGL